MIDTKPTGVTCNHLALIEQTDGWGHCPDCGEFESGTVAKAAIGVLTEYDVESRIEEAVDDAQEEAQKIGRDLGFDDGMESAFERVEAVTEGLVSQLSALLTDDENDDSIDIPPHWIEVIEKVASALDERKWEQ